MSQTAGFSYDLAFARNIGWLTEAEQLVIRGKRASPSQGWAVSHCRLRYVDLANFNRQIGATMHTIGCPKAVVLDEMARGINPELRIQRFDAGIDSANIDSFLEGVDLFVDGFDFLVLGIRRQVFARCAELGIPAVTAAPIGMGTGLLTFLPNGMSFEQY